MLQWCPDPLAVRVLLLRAFKRCSAAGAGVCCFMPSSVPSIAHSSSRLSQALWKPFALPSRALRLFLGCHPYSRGCCDRYAAPWHVSLLEYAASMQLSKASSRLGRCHGGSQPCLRHPRSCHARRSVAVFASKADVEVKEKKKGTRQLSPDSVPRAAGALTVVLCCSQGGGVHRWP